MFCSSRKCERSSVDCGWSRIPEAKVTKDNRVCVWQFCNPVSCIHWKSGCASVGVGYGKRQLKACSHSWLSWLLNLVYVHKSVSDQWFSMKIFWLLSLAILLLTYIKSINSEWVVVSSGRYLPDVVEDKDCF